MFGNALFIVEYDLLNSLCVYQYLPVSVLCVFSFIYSLCVLYHLPNSRVQYNLSLLVLIFMISRTRFRSSCPARCFGYLVSQIRHIRWICTRHLCAITSGADFFIAFKILLWPSVVMLSNRSPSLRRLSISSLISSKCSPSEKRISCMYPSSSSW